jgi:hypothetical protein
VAVVARHSDEIQAEAPDSAGPQSTAERPTTAVQLEPGLEQDGKETAIAGQVTAETTPSPRQHASKARRGVLVSAHARNPAWKLENGTSREDTEIAEGSFSARCVFMV